MFGTSGIRGRFGETVTAELALDVGRALASEGYGHVVVGRDARKSGRVLADAVDVGARGCGADVTRLGTAATPTIARSIGWLDADVGVSVTASHNPAPDNGIKLFSPTGRAFDPDERRAVRDRIDDDLFTSATYDSTGDTSTWGHAAARHVDHLVDRFDPTRDLTVVVDLGNGVGHVTVDALSALGCDVVTLNATPDGSFPGRPSEPTADNCGDLSALVATTDADLGIAHDGDADRMRAVTEDGEFVLGDALLAVFARETLEAGATVAVPVDTSLAVEDAVCDAGGSVERTPVGDVHVAGAAARDGVVFGGEPSGTWIWPEETLCPDAPYAACRLVAAVARSPLSTLVEAIDTYPIRRASVRTDDRAAAMTRVERRVRARYDDVDTTDGLRVETDDGWFLIRPSGTEPLVRVTVECRDHSQVGDRLEATTDLVEAAVDEVATGSDLDAKNRD